MSEWEKSRGYMNGDNEGKKNRRQDGGGGKENGNNKREGRERERLKYN